MRERCWPPVNVHTLIAITTAAVRTKRTLDTTDPQGVHVTFVSPRDAPKGKTTLTVVVQTLSWSQFPSGGAWITASGIPFWSRTVSFTVAVAGMLRVWITTGTPATVLMVISGKTAGL